MDISNLLKQKETQKVLTSVLSIGIGQQSMDYNTLLAMPKVVKMFTEEWTIIKIHRKLMENIINKKIDLIDVEHADNLNCSNYEEYEYIMNELYVCEDYDNKRYLRVKLENIEKETYDYGKYNLNNCLEVHYVIYGIIDQYTENIKKISVFMDDQIIYEEEKPQSIDVQTNNIDEDTVRVILLGRYGIISPLRNSLNLKIDYVDGSVSKNIHLLCSIKHIEHIVRCDILFGDTVLRYDIGNTKVMTSQELGMSMEEIKQKFKEKE